jgi:hypothetical protein
MLLGSGYSIMRSGREIETCTYNRVILQSTFYDKNTRPFRPIDQIHLINKNVSRCNDFPNRINHTMDGWSTYGWVASFFLSQSTGDTHSIFITCCHLSSKTGDARGWKTSSSHAKWHSPEPDDTRELLMRITHYHSSFLDWFQITTGPQVLMVNSKLSDPFLPGAHSQRRIGLGPRVGNAR